MTSPTAPDPRAGPADPAYESPEDARPASASSTEPALEAETFGRARAAAHDPYAALRYGDFRLFQLGWVIAVIGGQVTAAALAWEVYDRTNWKMALGLLGGIQVVPLVLLALPAGALADALDRRRIVQVTAVLASLCSIGLAFASYRPGSIPLMFGLVFALSTMLTLGRPARSALLPQLVPAEVFTNAVTWNSSFFQIASMAGAALGGLAIWLSRSTFHNARLAYGLDAGCNLVFAAATMLMGPPPFAAPAGKSKIAEPMFAKASAGVRFVWGRPIILATLTLDLFAVLLGGAVYLLPVFVKDVLHLDRTGHEAVYYGLLRAAEALGAIAMGMLIAHLPPMKKAGRAMLLAVAGFGLATIVFGLSRNFYLSFAAVFLIGAADNVSVVVRHTLVQVLTPDSMRGRVSAVNNIFIGASNELGGFESGATAQWFGPVASVIGGGLGTLLVVALIAWRWPDLRRYGSLQHAPEESDQAGAQ